MIVFRTLAFLLLLFVLAACVPAVTTAEPDKPTVALINAPTELRVDVLADELELALRADPASAAYDFSRSFSVRFQETHRDMYRSRAPLQAAFIARVLGADYAVMIAAPLYEREVKLLDFPFAGKRKINITVELQAQIVDPETALVLASFRSPEIRTLRIESVDLPLLSKEDDPDFERAREEALQDLAMPLATELAILVLP